MDQQPPKYQGVPVFMDGREYIVPSLSVRQFREHYEALIANRKENESVADFIDARIPVIGSAIRRNYPGVSDEQLRDVVDLGTFSELVKAIQAASGMKRVKPGEAQPVAE